MIALSTDDDTRQAGMYGRWPTASVRYVADPGGETHLRSLDLYNPEERGGIALPAMIVLAPDGTEVYRYVGRDFADRTTDDDVLDALDRLGLAAIDPPVGGPTDTDVPADLTGYFRPEHVIPYFKGNRFGAIAIGGRSENRELRGIAREHRMMSESTLAAWDQMTG